MESSDSSSDSTTLCTSTSSDSEWDSEAYSENTDEEMDREIDPSIIEPYQHEPVEEDACSEGSMSDEESNAYTKRDLTTLTGKILLLLKTVCM